jgi:hypothetical protein
VNEQQWQEQKDRLRAVGEEFAAAGITLVSAIAAPDGDDLRIFVALVFGTEENRAGLLTEAVTAIHDGAMKTMARAALGEIVEEAAIKEVLDAMDAGSARFRDRAATAATGTDEADTPSDGNGTAAADQA